MKSIIAPILSLFALFSSASAFASPAMVPKKTLSVNALTARSPVSSTSLNVFGTRKSKAEKAAQAELEASYWEGEWVCKDCGYIYQRTECAGMFFEEQSVGFRCPQCSGPRRRYAKKVGDRVGTTLDGGDAQILIFSFGGMFATILFGVWAVDHL